MAIYLLPLFVLIHVSLPQAGADGVWSPPQLCYTGANNLAPDYIVPCWPANKMPQYSCCKIGDQCLRHGACWNADTRVTYEYGCTDPTYQDSVCPSKCNLDNQKSNWVGLVYCNGTNEMPNDTWVCHHPDNCNNCPNHIPWDPELEKLPDTWCEDIKHDGQYVAFEEISTISNFMHLPPMTEISSWFSNNADRWSTTSAIISSGSATASATQQTGLSTEIKTTSTTGPSTIETTTETASPSPSSAPSEHKAVYIGIGVGAGGAVLILIAGLSIVFVRKHRKEHQAEEQNGQPPDENKGTANAQMDGENYGIVHKAELSAEERPISEIAGSPVQLNEMEGSTVGEHTPGQSPLVSPLLSQYSDHGGANEHRVSGLAPVHELPGEDVDGTRVLSVPGSPSETIAPEDLDAHGRIVH